MFNRHSRGYGAPLFCSRSDLFSLWVISASSLGVPRKLSIAPHLAAFRAKTASRNRYTRPKQGHRLYNGAITKRALGGRTIGREAAEKCYLLISVTHDVKIAHGSTPKYHRFVTVHPPITAPAAAHTCFREVLACFRNRSVIASA